MDSNRSLIKGAEPGTDLVADYIDDQDLENVSDVVSADSGDQSLEIDNEAIEMKLKKEQQGLQDIDRQVLIAPELSSFEHDAKIDSSVIPCMPDETAYFAEKLI